MMKRLITAATIRELRDAKQTELAVKRIETIITPEARTVASDLGITIIEEDACSPVKGHCATSQSSSFELREKIRASIIAQLPQDQKNNTSLINQLVDKVIQQGGVLASPAPVQNKPASAPVVQSGFQHQTANSGVKVVKGNSLKFGLFEGAGEKNSVGIVDVIGAEDKSPMAAGFMTWQNCFFPWTLTYDEVSYVIEGELHIRTNGETIIAKTGDVLYIPKGSSIEFGTPTHVRFLFVSYPVNWAG